jgi:uncharacterized protein (DUF2141 family)
MNHLVAGFTLCCALFLTSGLAAAETLQVKISGLAGKTGIVRVVIWKSAAGYPTQPEKSVGQKSQAVSGPEAEVVFQGLAKGTYAVAAYVDENSNGTLDRSFLGWPVEPTAASNDARGLMGPPSFKDAAFELKQPLQTIPLVFK